MTLVQSEVAKQVYSLLEQSTFIQKYQEVLKEKKSLLFEELFDFPKGVLAEFTQGKNVLVISSGERESRLYEDLRFLSRRKMVEFSAWETLIGEEIRPSFDIMGKRLDILHQLLVDPTPTICLAPLQSVLQKVPSKKAIEQQFWEWKVGDEVPFDDIPTLLVELGYTRVKLANDKGQFAVRGGIIDLFPVSATDPYRIEFFGDEIDTIRTYDPMGQLTTGSVEKVTLLPAEEYALLLADPNPATLLDYLGDDCLIIFDDLLALEDRYVAFGSMKGAESNYFMSFKELRERVKDHPTLYWTKEKAQSLDESATPSKGGRGYYAGTGATTPLALEIAGEKIETFGMHAPFESIPSHFGLLESAELFSKVGQDEEKSLILVSDATDEEYLKKKFFEANHALGENVEFGVGYCSSGFYLKELNFCLIPFTEFTHRYKVRREKWRNTYHTPVSDFHQIEVGDLVVHFHNGIGKYLGTEKQKNHLGVESEFLVVEYAAGSKLFVPMSQSHLISRYIGASESLPTLHQLGTNKWSQSKQKAQKAILGYAKDLLHVQAEREAKGGFIYAPDSKMMVDFEESFPYTPTEDQVAAVESIKGDMISSRAMDRLVCGDVGYGKTEVAMRAAFKAVVDGGKQVAILVPTTVLATQHFENFVARMEEFPVNVAVVSRFLTPKQTREVLEKVKNGKVDILIGTHRLISKDVEFKDLGLIIIDEEQRFGVRAKEKLKKLKVGADCITMTATPIPRTLYLSLVNAREMSVINSPPHDRLPIKTILAEKEDELIQAALQRELARDGQAFYIHNRVETIGEVTAKLQKLLPHARFGIAHGQMDADAIDDVFSLFKKGEIDVLVATTIVENGIDIPNANTVLVDRAHTFGMSDLYQIRGRVGRWNKSSYAYFLTPPKQTLPEISQKRLSALVEASGYGGGMKLAMRDLEIRGAGDILGTQQSGHVSSVGFHLYCKLLKKAVDALKNNASTSFIETKMEFTYDAKLPETYIDDPSIRLEIYHRLGEASGFEQIDTIFSELIDRFGPLPPPTAWLYHMSRLRVFSNQSGFLSIKFGKKGISAERQVKKQVLKKTFLIPPTITPLELEQVMLKRLTEEYLLTSVSYPPFDNLPYPAELFE
ncbi:MAG: Transcription-repair-coupling factor [Chlamydiia bacterium]|nr:Transcription-repair-coupling factor [Chlamydiia bacterium]